MNEIFHLKKKLYFVCKLFTFLSFHESTNYKIYDIIKDITAY